MTNSAKKIYLYIVETQELSRAGYRLVFDMDKGVEIAGEFDNLNSAAANFGDQQPNVLLFHVEDVDQDSVDLSRFKEKHPDANILVLADEIDMTFVSKFLAAHASGFCTRNVTVESLLVAVRAVAAGGIWFGPTMHNLIRDWCSTAVDVPAGARHDIDIAVALTERENEILKRVSQGMTNQQIADQLHLSVETVKTYVRRIMDKSAIRSRRELVARYRFKDQTPQGPHQPIDERRADHPPVQPIKFDVHGADMGSTPRRD